MPRKITRSLWKMQRPDARRKSLTFSYAIVRMRMTIEAVENKIPKLESAIKEDLVLKKQLESDLKKHKADRSAIKEAVVRCGALRNAA